MKKNARRLVVNGISLYLISLLFTDVVLDIRALVVLAIVFTFLNTVLKPILKILSLPITILTIGLFSLFINAFVLWYAFKIATKIVPGAEIRGFWTCMLAGLVLAALNSVLEGVLKDNKR